MNKDEKKREFEVYIDDRQKRRGIVVSAENEEEAETLAIQRLGDRARNPRIEEAYYRSEMTADEVVDYVYKKMDGNVADVEVYEYIGIGAPHFHGDYIESVEWEAARDRLVLDYEVMDKEEYDKTILANCCVRADFAEWYNDKDAKVLVVMI